MPLFYVDVLTYLCHNHDAGFGEPLLTHSGRVSYICVSKLTIIASDNGLSPDRRQAIIYTNTGVLLIEPYGTKFSEILIETHIFRNVVWKMVAILSRP